MNAKEEILRLLEGDEIEAISIGPIDWWINEGEKPDFYEKDRIEEALKKLDFEFDDDYGGEEGFPVFVWSKNWIIIKGVYDGSEWYERIPRNPNSKIMPQSIGGG